MRRKFTMFIVLIFCLFSQSINAFELSDGMNNDRVIVRIKPKKKFTLRAARAAAQPKAEVEEVEPVDNIKNDNLFVLKFDDELKKKPFNEVVKELEKNKEIIEVYPSFKYHSYETSASDSWHLNNISSIKKMKDKMPTTDNKVYVGVLDTGVDEKHRLLKDEIDKDASFNFLVDENEDMKDIEDRDGHGTHVAGLIGSSNIGSGKNVKLAVYKVLNDEGDGSTESMMRAVNHAQETIGSDKEIRILNMSLGYDRKKGMDYLLYSSLESYDGIAVIAAGNDGKAQANFPAAYDLDNIVSVGALTAGKLRADFSNYNAKEVDIFAPGHRIVSARSSKIITSGSTTSEYTEKSGTSMAAPIVTGVIAANYATSQNSSLEDIRDTMYETATPNPQLKGMAVHEANINGEKLYDKLQEGNNSSRVVANIVNNKEIKVSGINESGQLGLGNFNKEDNGSINFNNKFENNEEIKRVQTTDDNIYVITNKGNLFISGKNQYNQLNQYNKENSSEFVKFNKVDNKHKIKSIEFKDVKGKYNKDSIKIILEKESNKEGYYKLGKNSLVPGSKNKVMTTGLQYIQLESKKRVLTNYYKPFSNEIEHVENNVYYIITNGEYLGNYINYNKVTSYYSNQNKVVYTYYPIDEKYSLKKEYYQDKKGKTTQLIQSKYRNIYNYDDSLNRQLLNNKDHYYYDNNGKVKTRYTYNYNNKGTLQSSKNQYPNRIRYDYINGVLRNTYKANYNSKGNIHKQVLLYRYTPTKKYNIKYHYAYNNNLVRKNNRIITYHKNGQKKNFKYVIYNDNKKVSYLNRNYYKNKPSKDLYYRYNRYGKLKTQKKSKAYYYNKTYNKNGKLKKSYRCTYNVKGKKVSKQRLK